MWSRFQSLGALVATFACSSGMNGGAPPLAAAGSSGMTAGGSSAATGGSSSSLGGAGASSAIGGSAVSAGAAGSVGDAAGVGGGGTTTAGAGGMPPVVLPEPPGGSACTPGGGRKLYVSPGGSASGDGSSFQAAYDFATARSKAVAGDTLLLAPGKYVIAYVAGAKNSIAFTQQGTQELPIRVIAEEGGRAEFDFSFPEQQWVQDSVGFLVSGSHWSFCRLDIVHAGYQGAYVTGQHNTFENCTFHDNRNTGLEINKGGAYTTVVNSDAYRNYDPKKMGSMADGFGPKETQGPGNRFIGCRAWENSDDGFDAYNSPETVTFERSFAFRNGIDIWGYPGFAGNGNGFKVGGASQQANHKLVQCAAFDNPVKGFDQNNNTGGITIYNSTAFRNGTNFGLGGALNVGQKHDLRNNVAIGAPGTIASANEQNNAWNLALIVTTADFKSLDLADATLPRDQDGNLQLGDFLQVAKQSQLRDRGVDVGLPFVGAAPDLGAFEAAP